MGNSLPPSLPSPTAETVESAENDIAQVSPEDISNSLKALTWNVMGFTTVYYELQEMIQGHVPYVVVLTETKLTDADQNSKGEARSWIKQIFSGYKLFCSSFKAPKRAKNTRGSRRSKRSKESRQRARAGSGGVILAIRSCWAEGAVTKRLADSKNPSLRSHCVGVSLKHPHCEALQLWGLYMPFDPQKRKEIHAHLDRETQGNRLSTLAGDWNAALLPGDRGAAAPGAAKVSNPCDKSHRRFVQSHELQPLDGSGPAQRTRTFIPAQNNMHASRIDDVLIPPALASP